MHPPSRGPTSALAALGIWQGIAVASLFSPLVAHAQAFVSTSREEPFVNLIDIPDIHDVTELSFSTADESQVTIAIPFAFDFLGQTQRSANLGTNGVLTFGTQNFSSFSNQAPGTGAPPNAWIAPFWDDLVHPSVAGARTGLLGQAPHRVLVIEGGPASRYGQVGGTLRYQVWLYEGAEGHFDYRVSGTSQGSFNATIGYEGPDGTPFSDPLSCGASCARADLTTASRRVFSVQRAVNPELTGAVTGFPRGALPGQTIRGQVLLRNVGLNRARSVLATLYLSHDARLDSSDVAAGQVGPVDVPGRNVPVTLTATLTIPASSPPEDDFLLLQVDAADEFDEIDELDNVVVQSEKIATAHDLTARAIAAADLFGANPGEQLTFDLTIENRGAPFMGSLTVELFASQDDVLGPTDASLGQQVVRLRGRAEETVHVPIIVPNLTPGAYLPIAVVDPSQTIPEFDRMNNIVVGDTSFPMGPDFTIASLAVPDHIDASGAARITTRIGSDAVRFTGTVAYRLLASLDDRIDASDTNLGDYAVRFAGQPSVADTRTVSIPTSLPPARYSVIAVADPDGLLAELRETNNTRTSTRTITNGIDLSVSDNVSISPTVSEAGEVVTVSASIVSVGLPFTGRVPYALYLSADQRLDASDPQVLTGEVEMSRGARVPIIARFRVPSRVAVRGYHVIVAVSPSSATPEASSANNQASSGDVLQIRGADLRVARMSAPSMAFSGLPYRVELTLANEGAAGARAFRYAYYISDNDIIRFSDQQLFVSSTATIAAGSSATFTDTLDIPVLTSTRSMYLGVIVDIYSAVPETSESNNISRSLEPISLVFPIPNLAATIVGTPTAAAAGESMAVTRLLSNDGVEAAPAFDYAYYLSTNAAITTDDILVGRFRASLDVGEDDFGIDVLAIPSDVPPGTYHLGLVLDPDNRVAEVREDDDTVVGPTLPLYPPALRVVTESLPSATLGVPYRASVLASGGPFGIRWSIVDGTLPPGFSVDPVNGLIFGLPTEEGLFHFVIRAFSGTAYADRALDLRVAAPTITLSIATETLPTAFVGRPYDARIIAVGGIVPYRFQARSELPAGLTLEPDGSIAGTPTAPLANVMRLRVEDAVGNITTGELTINVVNPDQALRLAQNPLPTASVGREYCSDMERVRIQVSGGVGPYHFRSIGESIPGMTLDADTGDLCGTPMIVGRFPLVIRVQDSTGAYDTGAFMLEVDGGTTLAIATRALPAGTVGAPYSGKIEAGRGDLPYTFSLVEHLGVLPPGLALATDGTLSGTPAEAGVFAFAVQVVDAKRRVEFQPLAIEIAPEHGRADTESGCGCTASRGTHRSSSLGLLPLFGLLFCLVRLRAPRRRRLLAPLGALLTLGLGPRAEAQSMVPGTPYMKSVQPIRYAPLSSPNVLLTSGDDDVVTVTMPFAFRFYDTELDTISIGANGAIAFGASGRIGLGNANPGSTSAPNGFIAPFWDDMQVFAGVGSISTQISGTEPARVFTIEFKDVSRYAASNIRWSAQLRLHEGRGGRIQIDYGAPIPTGASFSATMGMEDPAGARPVLFAPSGCTTACSETDFAALANKRVELIQDPGLELTASSVTAPEVALVGGRMPIEAEVSSLHGARIGPFRVAIQMAREPEFLSAMTIGTATVTLGAFERRRVMIDCDVPAIAIEGMYWLKLDVDVDGRIREASEENNSVVSSNRVRLLRARADLAVDAVRTMTASVGASSSLRVHARVENRGSLPASTVVAIMLSTNPVVSREDAELARYDLSLAPGANDDREVSVTIPANASSGRFFIGAFIDPESLVAELSEANNSLASQQTIDVSGAAVRIVTTELPMALVGELYSGMLVAAGGEATRSWRIAAGRLPTGLGLAASTGELYGRAQNVENQTFTVEVRSGRSVDSHVLSLSVIPMGSPLTIVSRSVSDAHVGAEYSFSLVAVGGEAAKTWSATGLPAGLTLSGEGLLMGTPTAVGTSTLTVEVRSGDASATRSIPVTVRPYSGLLILSKRLPSARHGEPYDFQLSATGGIPPITFGVDLGALPKGLTLSPSGNISGTPSEVSPQPFRFVVKATDSGPQGTQAIDANTFELSVDDVVGFRIATATLPEATIEEGYDAIVHAEGGREPYVWSLVGTLPEGLASTHTNAGDFRIVGLPRATGLTAMSLRATDADGRSTERAFAIRVSAKAIADAGSDGSGCNSTRVPHGDTPLTSILFLAALLFFWVRRT